MIYRNGFNLLNESAKDTVVSTVKEQFGIDINLDRNSFLINKLNDFWFFAFDDKNLNFPVGFVFIPFLTTGAGLFYDTRDIDTFMHSRNFTAEPDDIVRPVILFSFTYPEYRRKCVFASLISYCDSLYFDKFMYNTGKQYVKVDAIVISNEGAMCATELRMERMIGNHYRSQIQSQKHLFKALEVG